MQIKPNRRKFTNFLISPWYQLKFVFWTTFTGFFLVTVNSTVFYYFIRENYKILVDLSPMEESVKSQLYLELHQTLFALVGFTLSFTIVMVFVGIVLSHRSAGPLYQFKRVFREIREGNPEARIRLRPRDEFRDVASEFNLMIDSILQK